MSAADGAFTVIQRPHGTLDIQPRKCQKRFMDRKGFVIENRPELDTPILIAGFDGWGNALDVVKTMAGYLIRKLSTTSIGKINTDCFYRYDETRPVVRIEEGMLKSVTPPGGKLYASRNSPGGKDLIILRAHEPSLNWTRFVDDLYGLCHAFHVSRIITLGSMYDNVLHTDRIVSGIASSAELLAMMKLEDILPISYFGPSGIHSTIHAEGLKRGYACVSLWCHCPYYLQGTTHFGLVSRLGTILSRMIGFELDTEELEDGWRELNKQIKNLVEKNPELQGMIQELRKAKVRGSWATVKDSVNKGDEKVIHLEDFLRPH